VPRSRGSFRGRVSTRRRVGWDLGPGGTTAQTNFTTSSAQIASAAINALLDGLTLVRTRGMLTCRLLSAAAVGDGFSGAFGIAKATTAAVAAGAASVPTPITEQEWDGWLYWTPVQLHASSVLSDTSVLENMGITTFVHEVDSKAMRKLDENESLYASMELVETGTGSLGWFFDSRMLFKLP